MGVFDNIRGRKDTDIAAGVMDGDEKSQYASDLSDASSMSLEAREDKEIREHPDQVTQSAHLGVQKAEATALVWSKKAVYASYAWYEILRKGNASATM